MSGYNSSLAGDFGHLFCSFEKQTELGYWPHEHTSLRDNFHCPHQTSGIWLDFYYSSKVPGPTRGCAVHHHHHNVFYLKSFLDCSPFFVFLVTGVGIPSSISSKRDRQETELVSSAV